MDQESLQVVDRAMGEPRLHRGLWYMGAKARVLPGFLDAVLEAEVPRDGTVVDLMCGTGVVSAYCAHRYRVFANDAQQYASIVAQSLIEHGAGAKTDFLGAIDVEADLSDAYQRNRNALERLYGPALAREAELLDRYARGDRGRDWADAYRAFLESPGSVYGGSSPRRGGRTNGLYARAQRLLASESIASYRRDPGRRPACLITAYYANVYFGLRQAIELDSLRAAIADLSGRRAAVRRRQVHYLSALIHAASVTTSGTSHFAQPRHLTKDSELRAMAERRRIDVFEKVVACSRELLEVVAATAHRDGNQCFSGDYRSLIGGRNGDVRFSFPAEIDLVYLDPPYTADNYSRFYHVLEVLALYDYPELEADRSGRILRGRYPKIESRFLSGFCRRNDVESEFRHVVNAAAGSRAKLVISYASPTGLLLQRFRSAAPKQDPVRRLEAVCAERYRTVRVERRAMTHSGQGEKGRRIEELLVVCTRPR
jgi:adenine-specific DNA-methyltransferase